MKKSILAMIVCGLCLQAQISNAAVHPNAAAAAEAAHASLWQRLISADGIMLDYVGELPTPEDCRVGRPNAIGWFSPIENGPMFTGLYLPAVCERAKRSSSPQDRVAAARLAAGLLKCAALSDVPGFIGRGAGADGRCCYPLGSEDQTFPWFLGLHAYLKSGIPTHEESARIVAKVREVAEVLEKSGWKCPCAGAFKGEYRGSFTTGLAFRGASHFLYLLRALYDMTGDAKWLTLYQRACEENHDKTGKTRVALCAEGYVADIHAFTVEPHGLWIYVGAQAAVAQLAAMETNAQIRAAYLTGLSNNAVRARQFIAGYTAYNNQREKPFAYAKWREGYAWEPQKTQADAERVANSGKREILGTRKGYERTKVTTPLSAAAIVAYAGMDSDRAAIESALCHYDYTTVNISEFFLAEVAYYALPAKKGE